MLSLLDLFSGIGGFSLGMEATKRINTVAFCEKDEYCRKVLKKHWSNTQQYIDIRDIDGTKISADIISGGFPCQPFSVAGKRKGTTDDRYLWGEMLRVITEVKPRWVVGENVQGIINIDNGLVLRQVQTDLEAQGFQVQCFLIPASGIGAWHKRNRVWIIANSNSRLRRRRGAIKESGANEIWGFYPTQEEQAGNDLRSQAVGCDALPGKRVQAKTGLLHSDKQGLQRHRKYKELETSISFKDSKKSSKTNSISAKSKTWWQTQSELCGVPDGISYGLDKGRTNRIKSLGNAIVPQIAYEIGKAIVAAEEQE